MKRYDVYWARLDPVEGSELSKTRPCVIVSQDALNASLSTVVVCPLTSTIRPAWRTRLNITVAGRSADVCADQIRTLSKIRLTKKLGSLNSQETIALRQLLTDMYGS
ncbi:MAG: type II toxin-antitoxin system PemK/MazF family toxin [Verrucomicrobiota bacterium]